MNIKVGDWIRLNFKYAAYFPNNPHPLDHRLLYKVVQTFPDGSIGINYKKNYYGLAGNLYIKESD